MTSIGDKISWLTHLIENQNISDSGSTKLRRPSPNASRTQLESIMDTSEDNLQALTILVDDKSSL